MGQKMYSINMDPYWIIVPFYGPRSAGSNPIVGLQFRNRGNHEN